MRQIDINQIIINHYEKQEEKELYARRLRKGEPQGEPRGRNRSLRPPYLPRANTQVEENLLSQAHEGRSPRRPAFFVCLIMFS